MGFKVVTVVPGAFNIDVPAAMLEGGAVDTCLNMDFVHGVPRALSAIASLTTPLGAPVCLQFFEDSLGNKKYGYGHAGGFAVWNGTANTSVMPASGLTGSSYWSADAFGSWLVCTNDKANEKPHAMLASSAVLSPLPGWQAGWDCTVIATHRNVLFAANMVEGGVTYSNRLRWSSSSITTGLPQEWVVTSSNDAGMVDLEIPGGDITNLVAFGDSLYVAGAGAIWVGRWQGGAYTYQFESRTIEFAPRGLRCMVSIGDALAVLTRNDLVLFDDQTHKSLMQGRVSSVFNWMGRAMLLWIEAARQLYVMYGEPNGTGFTKALIWDQATDSWGTRDFGQEFTAFGKGLTPNLGGSPPGSLIWSAASATWAAITGTWQGVRQFASGPAPVPGAIDTDPETDLYLAANASMIGKAGGVSYSWAVGRSTLPMPHGEDWRCRSLEVDVQADAGSLIALRLGSTEYPGESINWGDERTYEVGAGPVRHDDRQRGRYIAWQASGASAARITGVRLSFRTVRTKP